MTPIANQKIQGSIASILRDEILSGRIPSGQEMTQNELATSLGVSRMPVREALILLEYQGLVQRLSNNHIKVACFTKEDFDIIFAQCKALMLQYLPIAHKNPAFRGFASNSATLTALTALSTTPSDLTLHRAFGDTIPNALAKKTWSTLTEIYIAFALGCDRYDAAKGSALLRDAIEKATHGEDAALDAYFSSLCSALVTTYFSPERSTPC